MSDELYPSLTQGVIHASDADGVEVASYDNGQEQRLQRLAIPRKAFSIDYDVLEEDEYRLLQNLWVSHGGRLESFLFFDFSDPTPTGRRFGVGDGTTTIFKLPIDAATAITTYTNGEADDPQPDIDLETGVVEYDVAPAPAAILTFDATAPRYRVRFADPQLGMERFRPSANPGLWRGSISLIQVKADA